VYWRVCPYARYRSAIDSGCMRRRRRSDDVQCSAPQRESLGGAMGGWSPGEQSMDQGGPGRSCADPRQRTPCGPSSHCAERLHFITAKARALNPTWLRRV
jgi:hypothetical protein